MIPILLLIPVLTVISALILYRANGRRQLFFMDSVQFLYAFVIAPVAFVWLKSFIFVILRQELGISVSAAQLFVIDTAFSTFFLYFYAFVVMHSLTKSFNLRMADDPLYDVFFHSEYIHLWLSHLVMYGGGLLLATLLAVLNIWFPFAIEMTFESLVITCLAGVLMGALAFLAIWASDPKQERARFMRVMKLAIGIGFLVHVLVYFLAAPAFSGHYVFYWFSTFAFTSGVFCGLCTYRFTKARTFFESLAAWIKHPAWEFRTQVVGRRKDLK